MKFTVKVGSLSFEGGTRQKGEVIEVTAERAALFDPHDIEETPTSIVEVAPVTAKAPLTEVASVVAAASVKDKPAVKSRRKAYTVQPA